MSTCLVRSLECEQVYSKNQGNIWELLYQQKACGGYEESLKCFDSQPKILNDSTPKNMLRKFLPTETWIYQRSV